MVPFRVLSQKKSMPGNMFLYNKYPLGGEKFQAMHTKQTLNLFRSSFQNFRRAPRFFLYGSPLPSEKKDQHSN